MITRRLEELIQSLVARVGLATVITHRLKMHTVDPTLPRYGTDPVQQ